MKNYAEEFELFYNYVDAFYNNVTGMYPLADRERIIEAVNEYVESKPLSEIHFDSYDRECVREILEPQYRIL